MEKIDMFLEVVAFFGLFALGLFLFAEKGKDHKAAGILGALILICLGVWQWSDPMVIQTGTTSSFTETSTTVLSVVTTSRNTSTTNVYTPVTISFFSFAEFLSMFLIACGLAALFRYALTFYQQD